ncbi:MAG: hypothetical protein PHU45_05790 [Bacilli bacterium]|nr:hypothetical protein [Bacilli bacterium]
MKINIAHLYYDLLNLYGEQGNIVALKDAFIKQGVDINIDLLTVGDKINFNKYDLFYMGSGTKDNLLIALEDFRKYTSKFKTAIKNNKYFISTGNSHEIFGKFIERDNEKHKALDIFDYYVKQNPVRIVGESLMEFGGLDPILGFQNRSCVMQMSDNHLFSVIEGHADNYKSSFEGYLENNFFGTYLIGPLLIRNPHLTDYIVKDILEAKKLPYKEITDTFEYKAYKEYLKNFYDQ